ncbi:hypothetical protein GTA09_19960 [Rhodococcus hoagii]|nr:hypothetical protein [Prescottella equi]
MLCAEADALDEPLLPDLRGVDIGGVSTVNRSRLRSSRESSIVASSRRMIADTVLISTTGSRWLVSAMAPDVHRGHRCGCVRPGRSGESSLTYPMRGSMPTGDGVPVGAEVHGVDGDGETVA